MTDDIEIKCIRKRDRSNPHERIEGVGGLNASGTGWYFTEEEAIAAMKAGTYRFWTAGGGKSAWVIVAVREGREYLKTQADGTEADNLLKLPPCPL